jgi:hypothetical protein
LRALSVAGTRQHREHSSEQQCGSFHRLTSGPGELRYLVTMAFADQ